MQDHVAHSWRNSEGHEPVSDRDRYALALEELAHYLRTHPDVPVPTGDLQHSASVGRDDEAAHAEVDRVAGVLGVDTEQDGETYYSAERRFGGPGPSQGITYRAVAITSTYMAAWRAEQTYAGAVRP